MKKLSIDLIAITLFLQVLVLPSAKPAFAISVELAKKCRDLAIKSHPRARPGTTPYAQAERDFYSKCVSQNGEMQNNDSAKNPPPAPN